MKELHWNKYNAAADLDPFPDIRALKKNMMNVLIVV